MSTCLDEIFVYNTEIHFCEVKTDGKCVCHPFFGFNMGEFKN